MGSNACDQWTDSGFTDGSLHASDLYSLESDSVRRLFDEFDVPVETISRIFTDLSRIYKDQIIFESAIQSVPIEKLVARDMVVNLVEKAFQNSKTPESSIAGLLNIFINIVQAVKCDGSEKKVDLNLLIRQLKSAFKGRVSEMIAKSGGEFKYHSATERNLTMRPITEYLLRHGEHFLVLFCETSLSKERDRFLDKVVSSWRTHDGRRRALFLCGQRSFSTKLEEIKFYKRFSNAIFVPFVDAANVDNKDALACFEEMSSAEPVGENIVIPVSVLGLRSADLPSCLHKYNSLQAFPNIVWEQAEMQDFICRLHASFEDNMLLELSPKTRGQFEIKLTVNIQDEEEDKSVIVHIKERIQSLMEDPWSRVRQHMLHVYKLKNVRVVNMPAESHLFVEFLLKNISEKQAILDDYRKGRLEVMFNKQLKLTEINTRYFCTISIDEARLESLCDISQKTIATVEVVETSRAGVRRKKKFFSLLAPGSCKTTNDDGILTKLQITAAVIKEMVCKTSKYRPYEVFRNLINKAGEIQLADIKNEADHNLLHIIVAAARPEYLPVVFYLNLWDELRLQLTNSRKDPRSGGYTPRGLAEKLLYQEGGPETLEQYDYFDKLWLDMPLLHKACLRGSLEHVELLLAKDHAIDEKDMSDATCILYACATGSVHVVRYLLDRGANPNLANIRRENGLILAAKYGQVAVIDFLLSRYDFNQNDCDEQNCRALDYVAMNGDFNALKAFTDNGIQPDERMLSLAAKCGHFEMVKHLSSEFGLKGTGSDENGLTGFLHAASNGNVNMLAFLIENGVDVLVTDIQNQNCFHLVAEFNQPEACEYLIASYKERGILQELINSRNFYSGRDHLKLVRGREKDRPVWKYVAVTRTLRHEFEQKVESGHIDVEQFGKIHSSGFGRKPNKEILKQLDELALDKIKQCLLDRTSLMIAVWKGHRDVAMQLLAAGADPNITDYFGSTPLHLAAMTGDLQLVRELEATGVSISLKNNDQKTAADVAEENGHQAVFNFLEAAKYFQHANSFLECLGKFKKKLSDDVLSTMRAEGVDLRRYTIETVRDLKIDVNKALLGLGSGPVMEESCNTEGLKPHDFKSAFAGNQSDVLTLPKHSS